MRDIKFLEVGMKNYGPYIDPMVLTFEDDSLVLITGPNGIGKTMSLDAIPFTLYGVTSKGARGDDVVNNKTSKNCKTWVKFKINDDSYTVTRYHKYAKRGNTVIINQNGVDIKQGHKECLPHIERLVCPQKAFMNALMFGQKVKDFFTDLPDSQRKDIFRKVLDLEMFLEYYKFADLAGKDVSSKLNDLVNDINLKTGLLEDAKNQIAFLEQMQNNFEKEKIQKVNEKKKEIDECNRMLESWQKVIDENKDIEALYSATLESLLSIDLKLKEVADKYHKQLQDLDSGKQTKLFELKQAAQTSENEIAEKYHDKETDLRIKRENLKQKIADYCDEQQKEKHQKELRETECAVRIHTLENEVDKIESNVLNDELSQCPTCEQEISELQIDILKEKVQVFNEEIHKYNDEISKITEEKKEINKNISIFSERTHVDINAVDAEIKAIKAAKNDEVAQIKLQLANTIKQVEDLAQSESKKIIANSNEESEKYNREKDNNEKIKTEQEEILNKVKTAEQNIKNIENDIRYINLKIKEIEESEYDKTQLKSYTQKQLQLVTEIGQHNLDKDRLEKIQSITSFWKTAFSSTGMPSMLIDEAIPYMNKQVDYYLDLLTNGRYVVSFDTLAETKSGEFRDKISVHVLDTQTRANTRVQLSGGQTRIIDIAIILTLGDLLSNVQNVKFNILLFDEIFDALDEQNIQYVCKVLSKIKIGKSIYIISHQYQDHLEADETLAFS